jgi:hypothetical protein
MKKLSLIACAAATAALPAMADIYVIANAGLQLSPDEAREAFVGDKQFANGLKIVPLDNSAAQPEFLSKVLGMDATRYNALWVKKGFRDGLVAPTVKASDLEVVAGVKATPGAIGYVTGVPAGVTVIRKY